MVAKYIKTMDFEFENATILNCRSIDEIEEKIRDSGLIKIDYYGTIEYINASYIMYFQLEEEN